MSRPVSVGLILTVVVAVLVSGAPAALRAAPRSLSRQVKPGETAQKLAKRYYGKTFAARILLLANGLDGLSKRPGELQVGTTIRLPTAWSYRIRPGDTYASMAKDYLGDASKAAFLAWINGKSTRHAARAGHVILVPTVLRVKVPRRMSMRKLAARLLSAKRKSKKVRRLARRIRLYSGLRGRIRAGSTVSVPFVRLRLLGWYLPTGLSVGDPGTLRRAQARVKQADKDLRAGRYLQVVVGLSGLQRRSRLPSPVRLLTHHMLCTAYVALGRRGLALAAARVVLAVDPAFRPDPVQISPKVRAVYRRARGKGGRGGAAPSGKKSRN